MVIVVLDGSSLERLTMCGIIGVVSQNDVVPTLLEALKRLEYRGYDSSGIATIDEGVLTRRRAIGKLEELSKLIEREPIVGNIGIGHTRWATHGAPTQENAHPHNVENVSIVHNGIVENFSQLRSELETGGSRFYSETDTEVIAHLVVDALKSGLSYEEALKHTLSKLEGAFALCFLFEGEEDLMAFARKGSPLVIGYDKNKFFVGSDAYTVATMTKKITYLKEGDWGIIKSNHVSIFNYDGEKVDRPIDVLELNEDYVGKDGFSHFMLKEIHEQPTVVGQSLKEYFKEKMENFDIDLPNGLLQEPTPARIIMVGCGTAYYACAIAKYWIEKLAKLSVEVDVASEFRYRDSPVSRTDLVIFVSQSGETADTLASLRSVKGKAWRIVSIVNVMESSIARESEFVMPIRAGIEIGVASTKAFTCQLTVLGVFCLKLAKTLGAINKSEERKHGEFLLNMPRLIGDVLKKEDEIKKIAKVLTKAKDVLYMGRGPLFPLAMEGALKLKEVSYIHAEGYASGELKHGPIALIDKKIPIICFCPSDDLYSKNISNIQEVMARGGRILLITDNQGEKNAPDQVWKKIIMPDLDSIFLPILYAIPAQLLAYYTAVQKGTDVDQPRNLAKSVTVE